jgi:hypothetical protein
MDNNFKMLLIPCTCNGINQTITMICEKKGYLLLLVGIPGAYILENTPPPPGGRISADVIWGKKYEKAKRKRGKM